MRRNGARVSQIGGSLSGIATGRSEVLSACPALYRPQPLAEHPSSDSSMRTTARSRTAARSASRAGYDIWCGSGAEVVVALPLAPTGRSRGSSLVSPQAPASPPSPWPALVISRSWRHPSPRPDGSDSSAARHGPRPTGTSPRGRPKGSPVSMKRRHLPTEYQSMLGSGLASGKRSGGSNGEAAESWPRVLISRTLAPKKSQIRRSRGGVPETRIDDGSRYRWTT